jgi:hypothetical protein
MAAMNKPIWTVNWRGRMRRAMLCSRELMNFIAY